MTLGDQVKNLLSDSSDRIRLHDLTAQNTRESLSLISADQFPVDARWSTEEFADRVGRYEKATSDLRTIEALIAYWGNTNHTGILTLPVKRLSDYLTDGATGLTILIALRWYPIMLLTYSAGIAAVAGNRYDNLHALLHSDVANTHYSGSRRPLIRALFDEVGDVLGEFKLLPGHDRQYVPYSEYLLKFLQPMFDDLLFLGSEYESYFDRFELLMSLEYAYIYSTEEHGHIWAPIGRFGWKFHRGDENSPLHRLKIEAHTQGANWPVFTAGLVGGSLSRFDEIWTGLSERVSHLGWV